uniref:Uncharacterized protein n=1 Tax=Aegilops tauschii subsp. strangulata TaxID=200361 RepID=A0A453GKD6_AEGTS
NKWPKEALKGNLVLLLGGQSTILRFRPNPSFDWIWLRRPPAAALVRPCRAGQPPLPLLLRAHQLARPNGPLHLACSWFRQPHPLRCAGRVHVPMPPTNSSTRSAVQV